MNALWNKKDLERPANNIWVARRKEIDVKRFVSSLEIVIKDLESQNALHMEAAILSRLIYRMKSKFRSDKGLKNMEKVNRALLNYLEMQLHKAYKDLRNYIEPDGYVINLPTKQMVEYVLVRTQGFAKLICRIESVAKFAAEFFKARITIGHAWTVSVIAYAVVSRVWYLSRYLLKRCCAWYNSIFEHASKFKKIGPNWLPDNYDLPSNLKTWLDLPWIDQATDSVPLKDDGKETIFGLIKAQIDDPYDLNIENEGVDPPLNTINDSIYLDQDTSKNEQEISLNENASLSEKHEVSNFTDDIGMSIDRETFQLKLQAEVSHTQEAIESKEILKRKKEDVTVPKKSKSSIAEADIVSPVPVKRRKKILKTDAKGSKESCTLNEINSSACNEARKPEVDDEKNTLKKSKLKLSKAEKKSLKINTASSSPNKKTRHLTPSDVKTREDLMTFLSKGSYPGLDRLQWNMLINSVKKLVAKLEKCGPSDEKRQRIILKKVNTQIHNWIQ